MPTSFLNLEHAPMESKVPAAPAAPARKAPAPAASTEKEPAAPIEVQAAPDQAAQQDAGDFEIVLGRRQVASTSLVLVVAVVCFSGVSYLIGRSAGNKNTAALADAAQPASTPTTPVTTASTAMSAPVTPIQDRAPLFAEAIPGEVYVQVGAIDRGLAGVWAEGLRNHGLKAFACPGPSDKVWRVVVGPLPDQQSYREAKAILDQLGVETFGRRYTIDPPAPPKVVIPREPAPPAAIPVNPAAVQNNSPTN